MNNAATKTYRIVKNGYLYFVECIETGTRTGNYTLASCRRILEGASR